MILKIIETIIWIISVEVYPHCLAYVRQLKLIAHILLQLLEFFHGQNRKTLVNSSHNPDCPFDDFV